jgi:hypothetical protein
MLSRRSTLGAFAAAIAAWLWAGARTTPWPEPRSAWASDPETTAGSRHVALGRAYLRRYPEEASQWRLARLIPSDPVLRARQVRDDFATGRVVTLRGWVLSRTECRYCALHALSSA